MRNVKASKIMAVAMASVLVMVSPMTALADTVTQVTITGEGSETVDAVSNSTADTGVSMSDGEKEALNGSVTVNGNVSVNNKDEMTVPGWYSSYSEVYGVAIESNGGTGTVNISGNVNSDATQREGNYYGISGGVYTNANSNITIEGDISAKSNDYSLGIEYSYRDFGSEDYTVSTEIGGNVTASATDGAAVAISIQDKSTDKTNIVGDVKADGTAAYGILISSPKAESDTDNALYPTDNGEGKTTELVVGGDVEANGTGTGTGTGIGICLNNNLKNVDITVDGDIKGSTYGLYVNDNMSDAVKIKTDGTISSTEGAAIVITATSKKTILKDEKEVEVAADAIPDITVWKIESDTNELVKAVVTDDKDKSESFKDSVLSGINYIIKANTTLNGDETTKGQIKLTGTKGQVTVGDKTYDTANQGDEIIINVETVRGYKYSLTAGQGVLSKNVDGTYTLTIPEGGGVELNAVLEKIHSSSSGGSGSSSSSSNSNTNTWSQDSNGWRIKKSNGSYASNEWINITWNGQTSWYHFNSNGYADGGWFTDTDGQKYYLYNVHDGRFGYMLTGWHLIDGKWYFFNTQKLDNASTGSLVVNGKTSDGYNVDANGAWIQ